MYVAAFMCMDMISALAVYYATDVWHGYKLFGMTMSSMFIVAPLMVAAVVMFPLARVMMDKKSKQFAFRMGLPFYIAGGIMMAVMDPSWAPPVLVPIIAFMMGLGFGGAQIPGRMWRCEHLPCEERHLLHAQVGQYPAQYHQPQPDAALSRLDYSRGRATYSGNRTG